VLYAGRIVKTGGPELAHELERQGYDWIIKEFAPAAAGAAEETSHG
jgi:Fe-S cluster assembly ATP-binding protein